MAEVSFAARGVVKRYGGVVALSDGNLDVHSGEVVALLGANGSGKSTLGKIITGVVAPDAGQLRYDSEEINFASPQDAKRMGIVAVYQELSLIPDMTVAENIWLGHEPLSFGYRVKRKVLRGQTQQLLNLFTGTFSAALHPDAQVKNLPSDERQIVEILKAISTEPRLLILDEATASLDSQQVNRLFDLIEEWKSESMGIVFVSHRMDEIFRVADRATVLRNGKTIGTRAISETDAGELVNLMVEDAAPEQINDSQVQSNGTLRLQVSKLHTESLRGVSLDIRDGELVGLGGLQGQGQTDLLMALFGALAFTGRVVLSGEDVHFSHPRHAMKKDVALVPGDRNTQGLLLIRSILDNLQLPSWSDYGFPLSMERARNDGQRIVNELQIVMESLDAPVSSLSGGNAQKVVIGKWLLREPKLLLLNDPTKGVDVNAKSEFYTLLAKLRKAGTAILFYSTDDEELLGLCNRVLVLHDGQISGELSGEDLTRSNLVSLGMQSAS